MNKPDLRNNDILVHVNGQLVPRADAKVSVFDSSVQGGDAVWEGLRVYDGKVFRLEDHLDRFDVLVELNPAHAHASESERIGIAQALEHDIKSYVGLAARVRIVEEGEIERSQGKAKHVRDRRPAE